MSLVVDGQQRLVTLTLLAIALHEQAKRRERHALAERVRTEFLEFIDYTSDSEEELPRIKLSDTDDNETLNYIRTHGEVPQFEEEDDSVSARIASAYKYLEAQLAMDLEVDPFKRLGFWANFLTNNIYFAVFVHPDASSAYQVFEVINTRGRELTTADLLKNYILSQTPEENRDKKYREWQDMAKSFPPEGSTNTFVQYIRHVVTVRNGHILPKDLFSFLADRSKHSGKTAPTPSALMKQLDMHLPSYLQMVDPSSSGPVEPEALKYFNALNSLGVMTVRPILLALLELENSLEGMDYILRLVVRRIVVGNLGTGNVERRFSEAAREVHNSENWEVLKTSLADLNPSREDFYEQLRKRSLNKSTLAFLRRSILQRSITPEVDGVLHFIWPKNAPNWFYISEEEGAYWASTIGNTFLSNLKRRPKEASEDWQGFLATMTDDAAAGELTEEFSQIPIWDIEAIEKMGNMLADTGTEVWYG